MAPTLLPPARALRPERPRLPRRALLWYALAAALVVLTAATTAAALQRAARAQAAYGTTRPVVVALRPVPAGSTLSTGDVGVRQWPTSLAPPTALRTAPIGRVARHDLAAGAPVLPASVSEVSGRAPSALLTPTERAVPVPITVPGLDLVIGDRVDLLGGGAPGAGVDAALPGAAAAPAVIASGARVLAVEDETVVVAVTEARAAAVAAALAQGPVLLALLPPHR